MIRVEHSFLFTVGALPSLVFLIANHGTSFTCFDLQNVCRTRIPEYILIWILLLPLQWVCTMLCLHGNECDIFQQRVSCIIHHDLCVVTYCLFTCCSLLDKPQHGTDFSQICFEYGVSSLSHVYSCADCYHWWTHYHSRHIFCHYQWFMIFVWPLAALYDFDNIVGYVLSHWEFTQCHSDHFWCLLAYIWLITTSMDYLCPHTKVYLFDVFQTFSDSVSTLFIFAGIHILMFQLFLVLADCTITIGFYLYLHSTLISHRITSYCIPPRWPCSNIMMLPDGNLSSFTQIANTEVGGLEELD